MSLFTCFHSLANLICIPSLGPSTFPPRPPPPPSLSPLRFILSCTHSGSTVSGSPTSPQFSSAAPRCPSRGEVSPLPLCTGSEIWLSDAGCMMLATKWTGCKAPSEHSSQQLSLDVLPSLAERFHCLGFGSGSWQPQRRRAGSDVGDVGVECGLPAKLGRSPQGERTQGRVKGPFTPHSQTQLCHLREPKSTTLVRSSDSASPMAQKSSSVFTSKLSLSALGVIVF